MNSDDILWFKTEFQMAIQGQIGGTPLKSDVLIAIACQETGEIWVPLRKTKLSTSDILKLCVGDVIDSTGGRKAFPRTRAELENAALGQEMFAIARDALVRMAEYIPAYRPSAKKPDKFCHGYGIFQRDLQFFKVDPQYFLKKRYEDFNASLGQALAELKDIIARKGWSNRTDLGEMEEAELAIRYNTGSYDPKKGLKQGYRDSSGLYYGEYFVSYLRLSRSVITGQPAPKPLSAALLASTPPITATGRVYAVQVTEANLNLRSAPKKDAANVIAQLPAGQRVTATGKGAVNGFQEVETLLGGATLKGFAAEKYLGPAPALKPAILTAPPKVDLTPGANTKVTRKNGNMAYPLNEANMPTRSGDTPLALAQSLNAIVEWLAVDTATNGRYQPGAGKTYCNIYAYDYCCRAGVYLPRVWWNGPALMRIAKGEQVPVQYGGTVDELRANDLFRWLRDFGPQFGWRRAASLDELQHEADLGAVGLIVARRKEDGRSGHIVAVVPETDDHRARRDANGAIVAPLQSQAGARNFMYGTGTVNWWLGDQFAESAFWLHA